MKSAYENNFDEAVVSSVRFLIDGASVSRFHNIETIHRRTVADHSWGVAQLIFLLSEKEPNVGLIRVALSHDLGEQIAGDVPAPIRWYDRKLWRRLEKIELGILEIAGQPTIETLSESELLLLNMADILEGMMCCVRERRLGNVNVESAYQKYTQFFVDKYLDKTSDKQKNVFYAIQNLYSEAINADQ